MLRAWIPSLLIIPLAVAAAATGCGVGTTSSGDLGPPTGGAGPGTGGSSSGSSGSSGSSSGSGGIIIDMTEGGNVDVCAAAGLPPGCETMLPPACGDGMQNQEAEECDDGNTVPGDCCSGSCKVEAFCACPPGEACYSTIVCGDGDRGPGEACDDGNADPGDGCAADCHSVEIGYACTVPGQMCVHHYTCGDGIPDPNEGCDDKNAVSGDGCSNHCRIEQGYKCDGMPSTCTATMCGDKIKEGAESCDDGNTVGFDGCSPECRAEPTCPTGMPCMSSCGDGILFGAGEVCDDGNLRDGDGCSSTCQQEEGYLCNNDAPCITKMGVDPATGAMMDICTLTVPAIFRDFASGSGGHPDFQPGFNSAGAVQGLVEDTLDADGKPVQPANLSATAKTNAFLHGQTEFAKWYRDGAPSSGPLPGSIVLWDNGKGGYVNRWGANGEQWQANPANVDYGTIVYGGPGGTGCEACTPTATGMCYDPCIPWAGSTQACCAEIPTGNGYDGNPLFFPLDGMKGVLGGARSEGKVPAQYGWTGWPWESDVADTLGVTNVMTATAPFPSTMHNYSFTTEVKYWFKYSADLVATLDFTGDDDVWVFLNGHLSVDMGGWHVPTNGTLNINAGQIRVQTQTNADDTGEGPVTMKNGTAAQYGLTDGNVYQIQIFHAERQTEGSSFRLTLAGFNMTPSDCVTDCGDGMVGPGEECDDGMNLGTYNGCGAGCILGPRCGDAVVQDMDGEVCDDGVNAGTYGGCGPDCQPGPRCGDSVVTDGEQCDDGMNAGAYGGCAPGCIIGPHCGDGSIAVSVDPATGKAYEECDDGNSTSHDGCSNCKLDIAVAK
jgi:fibro-slime domain-containing protein